jgi:hypothetical protein
MSVTALKIIRKRSLLLVLMELKYTTVHMSKITNSNRLKDKVIISKTKASIIKVKFLDRIL